jgi:hypothetical protein
MARLERRYLVKAQGKVVLHYLYHKRAMQRKNNWGLRKWGEAGAFDDSVLLVLIHGSDKVSDKLKCTR